MTNPIRYALAFAILSSPGTAFAGESSNAWGTGGSGDSSNLMSAQMHQSRGQQAQTIVIGRDAISIGQTVSSCGACIYYQITGTGNTINDNTADNTNSGSITTNGTFGDETR